jgi:outer membrane protein assembly factor BamB
VDGNRVYVISGSGEVVCLNTADGDILWQVNGFEKFKGRQGEWGTAECALISENKVFYTPCGDETTVVALNKMTGDTLWSTESLDDQSGYVSAILIERGGKTILATVTGSYVIGVDTAQGQILWHYPYVKNHPTALERRLRINTVSPLYGNGDLFVTSGYDHVAVMLSLSQDGTRVSLKWANEVLDCHHGGVVRVGDTIYGSNWESNAGGQWIGLNWATGETLFETSWNDNKGPVVYADGMLYCCDEDFYNVGLVRAVPESFEVISSFKITQGEDKLWAHPSISDGRLYVRHGAFLMAYDIKAR